MNSKNENQHLAILQCTIDNAEAELEVAQRKLRLAKFDKDTHIKLHRDIIMSTEYIKIKVLPKNRSKEEEWILYIRRDVYDKCWDDIVASDVMQQVAISEVVIDTLHNSLIKNRVDLETLCDAFYMKSD